MTEESKAPSVRYSDIKNKPDDATIESAEADSSKRVFCVGRAPNRVLFIIDRPTRQALDRFMKSERKGERLGGLSDLFLSCVKYPSVADVRSHFDLLPGHIVACGQEALDHAGMLDESDSGK